MTQHTESWQPLPKGADSPSFRKIIREELERANTRPLWRRFLHAIGHVLVLMVSFSFIQQANAGVRDFEEVEQVWGFECGNVGCSASVGRPNSTDEFTLGWMCLDSGIWALSISQFIAETSNPNDFVAHFDGKPFRNLNGFLENDFYFFHDPDGQFMSAMKKHSEVVIVTGSEFGGFEIPFTLKGSSRMLDLAEHACKGTDK